MGFLSSDQPEPLGVFGWTRTELSAGVFYNRARMADGSVRCWGSITFDTMDTPTPIAVPGW